MCFSSWYSFTFNVDFRNVDFWTSILLIYLQKPIYIYVACFTTLHPLDLSIFKPLKSHFSKLLDGVKLVTFGQKYTVTAWKRNITATFQEAFGNVLSVSTIKNGFSKVGMYPLNPDVIDKTHLTLDTSINVHHFQISLSQSPPNHRQNAI